MTTYAFIDSETGAFVVSTAPPETVSMWWEVSDDADPNALCVDAAGEVFAAPLPRPFPWLEWAAPDEEEGRWVDVRTPEQREEHLGLLRAGAGMPRHAFCAACVRAGILDEDDAAAAALGGIPDAFAAVFDSLPEEVRLENRLRWLGAQTISRVDPIILACAAHIGLTEEQVDSLFGLSV